MLSALRRLVVAESPSSVPDSQARPLSLLLRWLRALDFEVELIPGQRTGGHLVARYRQKSRSNGSQLILGHCDTVWPIGTLRQRPFRAKNNVVTGPGVYDMKAGLVQMVFALRALHHLGMEPPLAPIVLVNSDEELGSPESEPTIEQLAQGVERAFVLEPSLGPEGKLKTTRKGVGEFEVVVHGRAAHAGLDPEKGASAILELSYVIQQLFAMNDPSRGVSVNVGLVEGGLRSNVIAPQSSAIVDVRVPTQAEAERVEKAILSLRPATVGTETEVTGHIGRPPMEFTAANRRLWELAQALAADLGVQLEAGAAGGGSDGNTTSQYTATLDGLGAVGDGAHAEHEFVYVDKMFERSALLGLLLLADS